MSREEEIKEASINYTMKNRPNVLAGGKFSEEMREFNRNKAFEEGAKWADKTMIAKACEWLKDNVNNYLDWYDWEECRVNTDNLLYDFRKAMEE